MISRGIVSMIGAFLFAATGLVAGESGALAVESQPAATPSSTEGWLSVEAGELHTCGIRADHSLWCWGENSHGEAGQGDGGCGSYCLNPTQVGTDTDWKSVSVGYVFTCGIRLDGTLWCWGGNSGGNLGLGDRVERHVPTQVGSFTDWGQIDAAMFHTCGLRENRTL